MGTVRKTLLFNRLSTAAVLCAGLLLISSVRAQLPASINDEIKRIKLLETDRGAVRKLLTPGIFEVFSGELSDDFLRENYNIRVEYSSGECKDTEIIEDQWFLGSDVWKVDSGKVVSIEIEPKDESDLATLGMNISSFRKERLFPSIKGFDIYFNKSAGMAITVRGDQVLSIELFPGERDHALLCSSDKVRRHYLANKWRFRRGPKVLCVLINQPASVVGVLINPLNGDRRELEVLVDAKDPENDILTYNFTVSGGSITNLGSRAVWRLEGVDPGSYSITASVDDGAGPRGRLISKTVVVD